MVSLWARLSCAPGVLAPTGVQWTRRPTGTGALCACTMYRKGAGQASRRRCGGGGSLAGHVGYRVVGHRHRGLRPPGKGEPRALASIGLAAFLGLVLTLVNLSSPWSGQIVEVHVEHVTRDHDGSNSHSEDRWYPYVRRDNAREQKVPADHH